VSPVGPQSGLVVESYGRRVVVARADGTRTQCKLKGRRLEVVAGDQVEIEQRAGSDDYTVIRRLQRRNALLRSDSQGREETIAANLDQLGVVVAPEPRCDPFIVDRYIAGAAYAGIAPMLIANKCDLPAGLGDLTFIESYQSLELPILRVSARSGAGMSTLIAALTGKRTLLAGQSGVGKSSLLNTLAGDELRSTGALSAASGEGRHTTVSSAILQMPWGELADSPGVRDYAPPLVPFQQVQYGFAEIAALLPGCRFQDCLHVREPHCAVQAAVADGVIHARRYESYKRLLNLTRQLDERRGWSSG
jgi:ribosome biogenesis GTPase